MRERWEQRGSRSALPSLPTYCYLCPQKKICLCTRLKACLAMKKGAGLPVAETEVLCFLSARWVQHKKARLGAAAGMERGVTLLSPLPAPFPLLNSCHKAGCRLAEALGSCSPSSKRFSAWKWLASNVGWKKSPLPSSPEFPQFEGIQQTGTLPWASSSDCAQDISSGPVQARAPSPPSFLTPSRWQMREQPRDAASASGMFPAQTPSFTGLGSSVKSPSTPRAPSRATASLSGGRRIEELQTAPLNIQGT